MEIKNIKIFYIFNFCIYWNLQSQFISVLFLFYDLCATVYNLLIQFICMCLEQVFKREYNGIVKKVIEQ